MTRLQRAAILADLAKRLRAAGSWCGETHVQKAVYLLQDLLNVPLEFEFILYRHGPFSFGLRDELTALRADGLFVLEPQAAPYGPKLAPTANVEEIKERFPKTLKKYAKALSLISEIVGDKSVTELERLATALYVTQKNDAGTRQERAEELHSIKPHIDLDDALDAMDYIDEQLTQHRTG